MYFEPFQKSSRFSYFASHLSASKPVTDTQVVTLLQEAEKGGQTVTVLHKNQGTMETIFDLWRNEFGEMQVKEAQRLRELEKENACSPRKPMETDWFKNLLSKNS